MARSRKRKASLARILLTIIFTALFVALAIFGIKYLMDNVFNKTTDTETEETVTETDEEDSNVDITITDYVVYKDTADELGFSFIIADLKFTTNSDTLYYDLNNLVTADSKVELGQIDGYLDQLSKYNYDLSNIKLTKYYAKSDTNEDNITVFIPYSKVTGELKVYYDTKALKFDLTENVESAESLVKNRETLDNVIQDEDTNKEISVSQSYVSARMLHNGEEYPLSSTVTVYTYLLHVTSVDNNVKIEDAVFIKDGSSYEYKALDSSYSSNTVDNIIGKTLKAGDSYALFFEVYQNGDDEIKYDGVLRIKFSDSDKWVEIPTTID